MHQHSHFQVPSGFHCHNHLGYQVPTSAIAGQVRPGTSHSSWNRAVSFFRTEEVKVKSLSHVRLFVTPWTIAYQVPPYMGFSRQEYSSELPFPSPGDLLDPGIGTWVSGIVGRRFTVWATREAPNLRLVYWKGTKDIGLGRMVAYLG